MGLDHFDGYEAADARIIAGGAEEIGFRLVDDPFADGVLMDMGDPVHQEARLVVFDPKRAAAVLPKMIFLQEPEGFTVFFEAPEHPIPAKVHFHFDGFQQCRGSIFFEVALEIGGRCSVPRPKHKVKMAAHQAPGIQVQALRTDKMVQGIGNRLFIGGPNKQIDLIYYVECQKMTGIEGDIWLFIRKHTLTCLK